MVGGEAGGAGGTEVEQADGRSFIGPRGLLSLPSQMLPKTRVARVRRTRWLAQAVRSVAGRVSKDWVGFPSQVVKVARARVSC